MEHKIFTSEQKQRAKNADLIEFLKAYMGFEFKKAGRYYQCVQHNSLVVYPDRKGFVWNSRNISGGDTIDFVRKVEGKSYPEAIELDDLYDQLTSEAKDAEYDPDADEVLSETVGYEPTCDFTQTDFESAPL